MTAPTWLDDTVYARNSIEVPEWKANGKPVVLFYGPWRVVDGEKLNRMHPKWSETISPKAMAEIVIMRAELEDGSKAFSPDQREWMASQPTVIINRIAAAFMTHSSTEELEKN